MSKSAGNGISPQEIMKEYGADILRLWVASADYRTGYAYFQGNVQASVAELLEDSQYGTLYPGQSEGLDMGHMVAYADMPQLDQWALMKAQ